MRILDRTNGSGRGHAGRSLAPPPEPSPVAALPPAPASGPAAGAAATVAAHSPWWRDPLLPVVLLAQAALCLPGMATRPLWLDEAFTAVTSRGGWPEIRAALMHDNGPALHYLLLHGWRAIFGESPLALRVPSLLLTLATTVLVHRLATASFDRTTARFAALLWAVHPLSVFYANQVRMYALYAFLSVAFLSTLWPAIPEWSWRRAGSAAVSAAGLIHTQNAGWFVLAAMVAAAAALQPRRILRPKLLAALAVAGASYWVWVDVLRAQMANAERALWWMQGYWSPWDPLLSLAGFAPLGRAPPFTGLIGAPAPWWIAMLAAWLGLVLLAMLRLRGDGRTTVRFLAVAIVLGLGMPALVSAASHPFYVPGRLDYAFLPLFLIAAAAGVRALRSIGRSLTLGLAAVASLVALLGWWRGPGEFDEGPWIRLLQGLARPGDVVLCEPLTLPQSEYGLGDRGVSLEAYPLLQWEEPALFNAQWYFGHVDYPAEAAEVVERSISRLRPGGRLWVVAMPVIDFVHSPLTAALDGDRRLERANSYMTERMGLMHIGFPVVVLEYADRRVAQPPP